MDMNKLFEQYKKWMQNPAEQAKVDASPDEAAEIKLFAKYVGKKLDYDVICELENLYDEYLIEQEIIED